MRAPVPHGPAAPTGAGAPTLLLVPTELEWRGLEQAGGLGPGLALTHLCGFGPAAAAARTARLVCELRPARALLVGLAGTHDPALHAPGGALEFAAVESEGIGVGEGVAFQPASAIGFAQWPGAGQDGKGRVEDRVRLSAPAGVDALLVSACAGSADAEQAALRRKRHPGAAAEDMEGFAVALACALAGVPLRIVRGLSNVVGVRAQETWRVEDALASARELALRILSSGEAWSPGAARTPEAGGA